MKMMPIQDLKAHLSEAVAAAASGETTIITRHNRPIAQLSPIQAVNIHAASTAAPDLAPAIQGGTGGRVLEILTDDRGDR